MEERISKIQDILSEHEAALITNAADRCYLTDFKSSAGTVVVTPKRAELLIDFRYFEKASDVVKSCAVTLSERLTRQIGDIFAADGVRTLLVQTEHTSIAELKTYQTAWQGITVSDDGKLDETLTALRSVKDREELARIRTAQAITDAAFTYILPRIDVGRTERDIMLKLEDFMRRNSSEGVAFDTIVVSGPNSALPHGVPGDRKLCRGDFVTLDFGAKKYGYCSDMTRTVALGNITEEKRRVYDTVLAAQSAAKAAIRAGAVCKEVDKAARDVINAAGYEGCFGHGLGHSVGIDIHEAPCCNTRDERTLQVGTVMTVEPGIYLSGKFGVRIEDMVVVTETGCETLTRSPKDLIIL